MLPFPGSTALFRAAEGGHEELVQFLLQAGNGQQLWTEHALHIFALRKHAAPLVAFFGGTGNGLVDERYCCYCI